MRKRKLSVAIIIILVLSAVCYFFLKPSFNYLSGFLAKSEQVNANTLIVEGWLPDYALKMAYDEIKNNKYDHIITTGIKSTTEYFRLAEEGYLIFYPKNQLLPINDTGPHTIGVNAYSEVGGENRAHFNLFINDSLVGNFFAETRKKTFEISWDGYLKSIDSIMVQFDNDFMGDFGDRNLFVKDIIIDHKITIPYLNNSVIDIDKLDGKRRMSNNYTYIAEIAKKQLINLGVDSSFITAVSGGKVKINRTLTSAVAVRDWLKTKDINITGIKIISLGTHARRTWMTYNKVLREKYKIGIISLPDHKNSNSLKYKILKTIRETLGIIYYWFILIPF
jgi:hypothetical protein